MFSDELLLKLLDYGIFAGLFVIVMLTVIFKGIPFMVRKFDEMLLSFKTSLEKQEQNCKENLKIIVDGFTDRLKLSEDFHKNTIDKLDKINDKLK